MEITRKIKWISTLDPKNQHELLNLQKNLINFYSNNQNYYSDISFTEQNWLNSNSLLNQDIIIQCQNKKKILEVGCGEAFILKAGKLEQSSYTGIDFSENIIKRNKQVYPDAKFFILKDPNVLPFPNESFDLVFSHFVIEHTVFPNLFLDECTRVLKPKGMLIIAAPDFLGRLRLSSQKVGFSQGTGREKLKAGKYIDMIVTAFDNKIRIPFVAFFYRLSAFFIPRFFININPTCFEYDFIPDVDAVYLTYEREIKNYLKRKFSFVKLDLELQQYVQKNKLIFLKGIKLNGYNYFNAKK